MAITENLETILGARYGRDVRQAIHDGIKQAYEDGTANGNANMEVSQARGGKATLGQRLDETDTQLAQKANQAFVDAQFSSIVSGAPKGTYTDLNALKSAYPNGAEGVFLVLSNGHWYYWSGSAWTSGGVYQATAIADNSVTYEKLGIIDFPSMMKFSSSSDGNVIFDSVNGIGYGKGVKITITPELYLSDRDGKNLVYFGLSGSPAPILDTGINNSGTYEFSLNHNDFLLIDRTTRHIYIKNNIYTFTKNEVLLAYCHSGEVKGGLLFDIHNWIKIKKNESDISALKADVGTCSFSGYKDPISYVRSGSNTTINVAQELWINLYHNKQSLYFGDRTKAGYTHPILNFGVYNDVTKTYTFALNHNESLFYNVATNTVFKSSYNMYTKAYKDILLASCHNGEIKGGILNDVKNWWTTKQNTTDISALKADINTLKGDISLPTYVKDEIELTKASIFSKQTLNATSFGFITDLHYYLTNARGLRTLDSMKELNKHINLDFIAMGGDNTADTLKSVILKSNEDIAYNLNKEKFFPIKGNHDDGTIYDMSIVPSETSTNYLTNTEIYNRLYKQIESHVTRDSENKSLYYYYDNKGAKIRYIFLNTIDIPYILDNGKLRYNGQHDYAFSNEQLNWVANVALKVDDGYGVVFIGHIPPILSLSYVGDNAIYNSDVLVGIMQAFRNGTSYVSTPTTGDFAQSVSVDYTSQGAGDVIAYIYGHVHGDNHDIVDGISYISTLNAFMSSDSVGAPSREVDTISELAYDIYTIDREQRKIFTTRFGAGSDREINY